MHVRVPDRRIACQRVNVAADKLLRPVVLSVQYRVKAVEVKLPKFIGAPCAGKQIILRVSGAAEVALRKRAFIIGIRHEPYKCVRVCAKLTILVKAAGIPVADKPALFGVFYLRKRELPRRIYPWVPVPPLDRYRDDRSHAVIVDEVVRVYGAVGVYDIVCRLRILPRVYGVAEIDKRLRVLHVHVPEIVYRRISVLRKCVHNLRNRILREHHIERRTLVKAVIGVARTEHCGLGLFFQRIHDLVRNLIDRVVFLFRHRRRSCLRRIFTCDCRGRYRRALRLLLPFAEKPYAEHPQHKDKQQHRKQNHFIFLHKNLRSKCRDPIHRHSSGTTLDHYFNCVP